jgi:hypothetical protein
MSGTRRTPIPRRATLQISARAVELFEQVERARRQRRAASCVVGTYGYCRGECPACRSWYDLQDELHAELGLKPWQWPCVPINPFPPGSPPACDWRPGGDQLALWQLLDQARRQHKKGPGNRAGAEIDFR